MTGNSRPIPALQVYILQLSALLSISAAHSLLSMLESNEVKSLKEIAEPEKTEHSYVGRMIKPNCLVPEIVAAILDDELPEHIKLFKLAVEPPLL